MENGGEGREGAEEDGVSVKLPVNISHCTCIYCDYVINTSLHVCSSVLL